MQHTSQSQGKPSAALSLNTAGKTLLSAIYQTKMCEPRLTENWYSDKEWQRESEKLMTLYF